jgi:hypothetical protein
MNRQGTTSALRNVGMAVGPTAGRRPDAEAGLPTSRHGLGTVPFPTRADFRVRLEAIGSGRWASHLSGARVTLGSRRPRGAVAA